jgi:hypothetical protein
MKVKINRVRGGSMGDQRNYGLVTGSVWNYELKPDTNRVSDTLSPVPRDEANIEAERGETIVGDLNNDGMVEHAIVGGKRHFQGGTPLNVPDGSFVFSDYNKLKIKNKDLLKGIFNYGGSKGATPAQVAKRYELNKYVDILNDPESDALDKKTAQLMLDNNMKKLGQLALVQEGMKGFPDGIPDIAAPLLGTDFQNQTQPAKMKRGGLVKAQVGEQVNTFPYLPTPQNELRQMMAQYPGNWLPEVEVSSTYPFGKRPAGVIPPGMSIEEYTARTQNSPDFEGWQTATGDSIFGFPTYNTSSSYQPGAKPKYKQRTMAGEPPSWGPALVTGLGVQYAPRIAKSAYDALRGMGMPAFPGWIQSAKNVRDAVVAGVKTVAPAAYKTIKKYPGVPAAGATLAAQQIFFAPAKKAFQDEQVLGPVSNTQSSSDVEYEEPIEYAGPVRNEYQEQLRQQQSQSANSQSGSSSNKSASSSNKPAVDREAIRQRIATSTGMDPADVTDEMIDNFKLGGSTLPIHQSKGPTGPTYNVLDKDVIDAAVAKELEAVRPYTYYNPNIPAIGSQLTTSGKYIVTPQGVITRKGATPIDIEQLKQYPIDWSSYGPGGFEDFKKDIQAGKGKESAASKWWVDTVNKYSVEKTGKPIFDVNQKGVYVPGYEWATPAFFREREKKAEVKKEEEAKTESSAETKTSTSKPEFKPGRVYGLGQPFPSDVVNMIVAGNQRIPDIDVMLGQVQPSLVQPVYTNPMLEQLSAITAAAEGAGEGPAKRASKLGIAGKAMDAAAKIIQQNAANNQNIFLQTQAQNANALNQANAANQQARMQYLADVNNRRLYLAQQLNKKDTEMAGAFGDMYNNMYKQMLVNAQYPYQTSGPYGVAVNPELTSTSQTPLLGNVGGNNIDAIYTAKFNEFSKTTMSPAEAAKAASDYIRSIGTYSPGTQGAAHSPFDIT